MMMGKRTGQWAWALSAAERLTAARMEQARGDGPKPNQKVQRAHRAMLAKQAKLLARGTPDAAARRPAWGR